MSIKENHEPIQLNMISTVKVHKLGRCPIFILSTTNKTIKVKKAALWEKLNEFKNVTSLIPRHCRSRKKTPIM